MTGIILAGGKSSRMGRDKALVQVDGNPLVARTCFLLRELFPEVIVVTNSPLQYLGVDTHLVTDIYPGAGALGGILSGLVAASHFHSFVVACDMPFLRRDLISYMVGLKDVYDVVIPDGDDGPEPLHAVYSRRCITPILEQVRSGRFKILDFMDRVKVRKLTQQELEPFLGGVPPFYNINTPEELERAVTILSNSNIERRA